jgi:hypothetical protein
LGKIFVNRHIMYAHIPRGFHDFARSGSREPKLPNPKSGFLSPSTLFDYVSIDLICSSIKSNLYWDLLIVLGFEVGENVGHDRDRAFVSSFPSLKDIAGNRDPNTTISSNVIHSNDSRR